ncbi:UPF0280 family protein [Dongia soli]|uniref:UPF0280 family protein n=1 Tax=Dongia soli TaxID=600628 RepID=A0ABU5EB50_9PROT|nr:UPF0280 family protein [Dongia soli]MDY0882800.1 UPF0280 family protein [Dongia soli]
MTIHCAMLPDGRRLHLQHGPIDLVIEAWGEPAEVGTAYGQAAACFQHVLHSLVAELPVLRQAIGSSKPTLRDPVAQHMLEACWPYRADFITPMAAVAGAVADHVLAALLAGRRLRKAYVNNGGDIAIHLTPGEFFDCGLVADLALPRLFGKMHITSEWGVGGLATSGAATKGNGGRSFSFGIADSVTVLAINAAAADAAASMIANAVDLPAHPSIDRQPASAQDPDSDLGARLVTMKVPPLGDVEIEAALARGLVLAEELRQRGLIEAAVLTLQGQLKICGAEQQLLSAA